MSQKRKGAAQKGNPKRSRGSNDGLDNVSFDPGEEADSRVNEEIEPNVGIIESISLKNFMCHSRLNFKLGRNVNFIVGKNGSGKSAVLTAIVVGLGGKATATNRGTSIKSFIKNEQKFAEVVITLRNKGSDGYKAKEYGEKIIIHRRFTPDGTSTYRICDSTGHTISNKREELTHILDQFNIQVDNPVSILNQEVSRNFLHSKSPHDKYKFFLKATQLEQMDRDYNSSDQERRIAKNLLENKQLAMPRIEKEVKDWEKKYRIHESLDRLRDRLEEVKNEAAWAQVAEIERQREDVKKHLDKEEKRRPKFVTKVDDSKKNMTENKRLLEEVQGKLTHINQSLQTLTPQRDEHKEKLRKEKEGVRSLALEMRETTRDIAQTDEQLQRLKKTIEEEKTTALQLDIQKEKERRLNEINSKTESLKELDAKKNTTNHHCHQLQSAVIKAQDDADIILDQTKQIKAELDRKNRDRSNLQGSRHNTLQKFGAWVPELTRKIEAAFDRRQFKRKPLGPLGAFISLKDPKWALAVEICLGGMLHSYVTDSHEDEKTLEKLMKETIRERRPNIIVGRYTETLYDVTRNRAQSNQYNAVLDVVDVKETIVTNFLIDKASIENVLLIENQAEARELMSRNPPRNCFLAYTASGDKVFPSPSYRYYGVRPPNRRPKFLQESVDELIKGIEDEIQDLRNKQKEYEMKLRAVNKDVDENKRELETNKSRSRQIQQEIQALKREITELSNIDDPDPVDLSVLEQEVVTLEESLMTYRDKFDQQKIDMAARKEVVKDYDKIMNELEHRINAILTTKCDPLKEALNEAQQRIANAEKERKHYESLLKTHDGALAEIRQKLDAYDEDIKTKEEKALRICPRINTKRDAVSIDNEIVQVTTQLENEERMRGSKEEVTRRYYETKKQFESLKKQIADVKLFIQQLSEVLKNRRGNYANFRRLIAWRVNNLFIIALRQRNYNGKIDFDHTREMLTIKAQPLQNVKELSQDMRALSGGERSFSTISFILAIWDAMESPFRILDEFDVFMDMVTRRVSMNMLLESAVTRSSQYCFLTPLDITPMNESKCDPKKIKTFKMADPERNQAADPDRSQITLPATDPNSWDGEDMEQD